MEPETNNEVPQEETSQNSFNTVTPLSKFLALALFIILPFVGGWIGYHYAPEKVVEVERAASEDPLSTQNDNNVTKYSDSELLVDDRLGLQVSVQYEEELDASKAPTRSTTTARVSIGGNYTDTITLNEFLSAKIFKVSGNNAYLTFGGRSGYPAYYAVYKVDVADRAVTQIYRSTATPIEREELESLISRGEISCGFRQGELEQLRREGGKTTLGDGFVIWTPDQVEVIADDPGQRAFTLQHKASSHTARLEVIDLRRDVVVAKRINAPSFRYDTFSQSWLSLPFNSNEIEATVCSSGDVPQTDKGDPIFVSGDADVGYFTSTYTVIIEVGFGFPEMGKVKKAVQIHVAGDRNSSDFEQLEQFISLLEQMVQTVEPKVFKG